MRKTSRFVFRANRNRNAKRLASVFIPGGIYKQNLWYSDDTFGVFRYL